MQPPRLALEMNYRHEKVTNARCVNRSNAKVLVLTNRVGYIKTNQPKKSMVTMIILYLTLSNTNLWLRSGRYFIKAKIIKRMFRTKFYNTQTAKDCRFWKKKWSGRKNMMYLKKFSIIHSPNTQVLSEAFIKRNYLINRTYNMKVEKLYQILQDPYWWTLLDDQW